jgi:hypothetical protein
MKAIINIALVIFAVYVITFFFNEALPIYLKTLKLVQENRSVVNQLKHINELQQLANSLKQRSDIRGLLLSQSYFNLYLPPVFKDYEVFLIVNQLLEEHNLPKQNLSFSDGQPVRLALFDLPLVKEKRFKIVADGSYDDILNFLADITSHSRIFTPVFIKLNKLQGSGISSSNNIKLEAEIATYAISSPIQKR